MFDGNKGTRELTSVGHERAVTSLDSYTVKPGESIWSLSERYLNDQGIKNPTVYEIDATKDRLLSDLRTSGQVDANGMLNAGQKIRLK